MWHISLSSRRKWLVVTKRLDTQVLDSFLRLKHIISFKTFVDTKNTRKKLTCHLWKRLSFRNSHFGYIRFSCYALSSILTADPICRRKLNCIKPENGNWNK